MSDYVTLTDRLEINLLIHSEEARRIMSAIPEIDEEIACQLLQVVALDNKLHHRWKKLGARLRERFASEKEMIDRKGEIRELIFLTYSDEQKKAYYCLPSKEPDPKAAQKAKHLVQRTLSNSFGKVLQAAFPNKRIPKPKGSPTTSTTTSGNSDSSTGNSDSSGAWNSNGENSTGDNMNEVEMNSGYESGWNSSNNTTADNSEAETEEEVASNTNTNSRKRRDSVVARKEGNKSVRKEVNKDHITQVLMETRKAILKIREEGSEAGQAIQDEITNEETRLSYETPEDQNVAIDGETPITVTVGLLQNAVHVFHNLYTAFDDEGALNPQESGKVLVLAEGETEEDHQPTNNVFNP